MTLLSKINGSQIDFDWASSYAISATNYIEVSWELIEFK